MSLDLLVAEKWEQYHSLNFCTHIVSGVMLTLSLLLWVLRLVVSPGWLWWSEVSEKAVSISSPFLGWMQCSPWLSICFFLGSALDPFYMYSNMLLHFFSGPCTTYYGRCPLCTLDTHFVLSVTTKPSFASSRSASFSWPSVSCVAVGLPSASLCPIFYHPIPVLLCAASCVPTAQGPCYCAKLVFLHTVLCLSEKCLFLLRMGGAEGVTTLTCWVWSTSGVSVFCASPVLCKHFCPSEWLPPTSKFHKQTRRTRGQYINSFSAQPRRSSAQEANTFT